MKRDEELAQKALDTLRDAVKGAGESREALVDYGRLVHEALAVGVTPIEIQTAEREG